MSACAIRARRDHNGARVMRYKALAAAAVTATLLMAGCGDDNGDTDVESTTTVGDQDRDQERDRDQIHQLINATLDACEDRDRERLRDVSRDHVHDDLEHADFITDDDITFVPGPARPARTVIPPRS
jgi:hypothetical protein